MLINAWAQRFGFSPEISNESFGVCLTKDVARQTEAGGLSVLTAVNKIGVKRTLLRGRAKITFTIGAV